ncbi:hypothetical protein Pcinc_004753 [Petrolisthes cinctipes]|uniref:Uncharacterized protein n=1 Tax=Petrolisthes cinctipes TaxID=88211 RepID=A0AAE1GER9_PETCI|nr:hypothetical protein Pcinc_004753 [Petrolisthes cinctipes]
MLLHHLANKLLLLQISALPLGRKLWRWKSEKREKTPWDLTFTQRQELFIRRHKLGTGEGGAHSLSQVGRWTFWAGAGRGRGQSSAAAPMASSLPTDLNDGVDTVQCQGSGNDSSGLISTQLGGSVDSARVGGRGATAPPSADPSAVASGAPLGL